MRKFFKFDYLEKEPSARTETCRIFYCQRDLSMDKISGRRYSIRIFPKYLAGGWKSSEAIINSGTKVWGNESISVFSYFIEVYLWAKDGVYGHGQKIIKSNLFWKQRYIMFKRRVWFTLFFNWLTFEWKIPYITVYLLCWVWHQCI